MLMIKFYNTPFYAALKEHVEKVGFHHYDYDPRFRQTNRSRECAWNYTDYFRCMRVLGDRGDDTTPCQWFKKQYFRVCQENWKQMWDDQREDGVFWGKIY